MGIRYNTIRYDLDYESRKRKKGRPTAPSKRHKLTVIEDQANAQANVQVKAQVNAQANKQANTHVNAQVNVQANPQANTQANAPARVMVGKVAPFEPNPEYKEISDSKTPYEFGSDTETPFEQLSSSYKSSRFCGNLPNKSNRDRCVASVMEGRDYPH